MIVKNKIKSFATTQVIQKKINQNFTKKAPIIIEKLKVQYNPRTSSASKAEPSYLHTNFTAKRFSQSTLSLTDTPKRLAIMQPVLRKEKDDRPPLRVLATKIKADERWH